MSSMLNIPIPDLGKRDAQFEEINRLAILINQVEHSVGLISTSAGKGEFDVSKYSGTFSRLRGKLDRVSAVIGGLK